MSSRVTITIPKTVLNEARKALIANKKYVSVTYLDDATRAADARARAAQKPFTISGWDLA